MENKVKNESKTGAIIGTIAAIVLCGCPGLFLCVFGGITAAGQMPYNFSFNEQSVTGMIPSGWGYLFILLALIFIAIPIVVGVLTLRKPKARPAGAPQVKPDEPLPPPS